MMIQGFRFSGIIAGIKEARAPDLALIASDVPAQVVGCFTTNKVQAAPVLVSKKNVRSGLCSAVIINSGNANACTGDQGLRHAEAMVRTTARLLQVPEKQVLVSSTGKIGMPLPIDRIVRKIPEAIKKLSSQSLKKCAEAILTTDNSVKIASSSGEIGGKAYRIVGFAKGAGMIAPQMEMVPSGGKRAHATMLAYILTDAALDRRVMQILFQNCVEETFNAVTVDGDTSTNDTTLFLANGLAGNTPFKLRTPECRKFAANLYGVMESLAKMMVSDGEGATKCVRIEVKGTKSVGDAKKIAVMVANSLLVKTSFFGQDPNWGRLMGALGRAGVPVDPERVDIYYGPVCVARGGRSTGIEKDRTARKVMRRPEFTVTIDCHLGQRGYGLYTSDLTLDYVKLNSCYRT